MVPSRSRRRVLRAVGGLALASVAGCLGDEHVDPGARTTADETTAPAATAESSATETRTASETTRRYLTSFPPDERLLLRASTAVTVTVEMYASESKGDAPRRGDVRSRRRRDGRGHGVRTERVDYRHRRGADGDRGDRRRHCRSRRPGVGGLRGSREPLRTRRRGRRERRGGVLLGEVTADADAVAVARGGESRLAP